MRKIIVFLMIGLLILSVSISYAGDQDTKPIKITKGLFSSVVKDRGILVMPDQGHPWGENLNKKTQSPAQCPSGCPWICRWIGVNGWEIWKCKCECKQMM